MSWWCAMTAPPTSCAIPQPDPDRFHGQSFIPPGDSFAAFGTYITAMMKRTALSLLLLSTPVLAQTVPDPSAQRYETQNAVNQQILQTQQNNLQIQQGLQQNEMRQQQLFNSMPPPAYMQQPRPFTPKPATP